MTGGDVRKLTSEQKASIPGLCASIGIAATAKQLSVTEQTIKYHLNRLSGTLPNCSLCACGCGKQVSDPRGKYTHGHDKRKLSQTERDKVCELYDEGMSTPELSKRYGLTDTNIWRILKSQGTTIRSLSQANTKILAPVREQIIELYKQGVNTIDIANKFSITFQEVYIILHKAGIPKGKRRRVDVYYNGVRGIIKMKSSWELEVAYWLDHLGYNWLYEPHKFKTPLGGYIPDFYIPDLDVYVEVKGAWYPGKKGKVEAFVNEYPLKTLFTIFDIGIFGKLMLAQKMLEKIYGHNVAKMCSAERLAYFKEHMLKLYAELAEMLQEWPWKDHKTYTNTEVDRDKFLSEYVDCLIYLVNAVIALDGVTEIDIYKALKMTETKNFTRAREGYRGGLGEDLKGSNAWKSLFKRSEKRTL